VVWLELMTRTFYAVDAKGSVIAEVGRPGDICTSLIMAARGAPRSASLIT